MRVPSIPRPQRDHLEELLGPIVDVKPVASDAAKHAILADIDQQVDEIEGKRPLK